MNRRNRALKQAFRYRHLWEKFTYEEPGDDLSYIVRQQKRGLNILGDWRYPWRSIFTEERRLALAEMVPDEGRERNQG